MIKISLSSLAFRVGLRCAVLGALALVAPGLMAQSGAAVPGKQPVPLKKHAKVASKSRADLKSDANQMASGIRAAEAALTPAELVIAQRVEVGYVQCELGASVTVVADPKLPGYFDVHGKKFRFRMVPVVTSTGAIRLEDTHAGAVWLQLANKSMLMNQKLGLRLADACVTPAQALVAAAMERSPPPGLLDAPVLAKPLILPMSDSSPVSAIQ
ncbi:MAG: hypothetical protein PHQ58_10685 [Rhodoferax sp.]|uniref:hypothetical protein n=1 Tax=Rhodoferax sp. TaxID=50421 RepID=UPI002614BBCB|nr:hypothetical protein [Rhodoferax sp.]MDD2880897.1 hypothetical protein [Rhodoferax sp.]